MGRMARMVRWLKWSSPTRASPGPHHTGFPRILMRRATLESHMPLMTVLVTLIVVGVLLWMVNSFIPMDAKIKQILNVVAVIAVICWVLNAFGLFGQLGNIRVGKS